MDFNEWFDVENEEHIDAFKHLKRNGCWPEMTIPAWVQMDHLWYIQVLEKIADKFLGEDEK